MFIYLFVHMLKYGVKSKMTKPIYTQKHFKDMAKFILELNLHNKYVFAQEIAKHFQDINPKFDVDRFFKACGILLDADAIESDGQPTEQQEFEELEGLETDMYPESDEY